MSNLGTERNIFCFLVTTYTPGGHKFAWLNWLNIDIPLSYLNPTSHSQLQHREQLPDPLGQYSLRNLLQEYNCLKVLYFSALLLDLFIIHEPKNTCGWWLVAKDIKISRAQPGIILILTNPCKYIQCSCNMMISLDGCTLMGLHNHPLTTYPM